MHFTDLARIPKRVLRRIYHAVSGGPDTPEKMWGRVFDLQKKEIATLGDFGLFVMPNDYIGRSILSAKQYEHHVTKVVRDILKPGGVFLDLGANLGYFTMLGASIVGESGKVIAFEPNPQNQQLIFESIAHNKFKNVHLFPLAASDRSSILRFTTVGSNGGVVTENSSVQTFYMFVQAVPLDKILSDEPRIDLIKMDIEAHEPFALKGMENTIRRLKPHIITEFHPWAMKLNNTQPPIEFLEQLKNLDYSLFVIEPTDGSLSSALEPHQIIERWKSQADETVQIDLLAKPS
jgi:FkbM family methyltransferase